MNAITISRQMGAWGRKVAEATAELLGYKLVWREVINQAALRAGVPEVALAAIDEFGFMGIKPREEDLQAYHRAVRQIMEELVREGRVVIIGRAGQCILADNPRVFHIRVIAPIEVRISRVAEEQKMPPEQARILIERSDRFRQDYLKRFYHANIDDPTLYDLVLNTHRIDIRCAAHLIESLVRNHEAESSPGDFHLGL
ncbi:MULTISPECIES: AAA family ATPase [Anaerolinea]|uniref:cytidylate kinase-like family protein n=1 Tax=Anaerolinea TaxID=233189 RepID=UPI00261664C4|nr:cytidylate kinase-like family protein [Anaerolinea thermophila]